MVVTREKGVRRVVKGKGVKYMVMEGDLTLGGGHTMQHTGDVSQNYALET